MPKVSVIIPVYGVEKYIERCARSLFEQTLVEIEYLFIDDCTPDRSIDVLKKVLEMYPQRKSQVTIHRMKQNSGQAKVREWGMRNATGEYVIHCDSDDWVDVDTYKTLYDFAIESNSDIVYYDYYRSDGESHTVVKRWHEPFKDKDSFLRLLISARVSGSLCLGLTRRSLYLKNFSFPEANMGEDLAMMLQMAYNCTNRISYLSKAMYYYRDNASSISKAVSEDCILKRLGNNITNGNQMFDFLERMGIAYKMSDEIEVYKFMVRKNLFPLLGKKDYYRRWYMIYPEINKHFLFNKVALAKDKVLFVLCFCRLYSLVR